MEKYEPYERKKLINVYYDLAVSKNDTVNIIRNKGLITFSLLKLLDSYNYKTNLTLFSMIELDKNNYVYIKYNFNKNNYETLYYPMCHTGFNRLILLEILKRLSSINSCYSYPAQSFTSTLLNINKHDIYISHTSTAIYNYKDSTKYREDIFKSDIIDSFNGDDNLIHDTQIFLNSVGFDRFTLNNKKLKYNDCNKKFELKLK